MSSRKRAGRGSLADRAMLAAITAAMAGVASYSGAAVTINKSSNTSWTISNGQITAIFNPSSDDITSVQLGSSANLLGGSTPELDEEFAGTPFGSGPQTFNSQAGPNNSYQDVWTTTASAQNASGGFTNPITYSFHYLIFANDPTIYCYEVLNHAATDPATSVGQGQFLFRSNPSLFPNLYQINTGPHQQGAANAVTTINVPSTYSNWGTVSAQAGRTVQNAATDLTGSGIPGDAGTNFFTKYDYSIYTQFFQAETMYGTDYAVTEVDPSTDTLSGGPTKQELAWTDPGILNMEFLSGHYGFTGSGSGEFPGYSYYPQQGVASSKLYGPYGFTISSVTGTTAPQINQNVINSIPTQQAEFNTDTELASTGYINTTARGMVQITASNSAGWSSNSSNNTVVLSDPGVNFQESTQGYQYSGQLSQSGTVTIGNVVPGTYRLSLYELGQWGETRVDGVQVNGNTITLPQNVKFTPENFGTAPPIWTLGTPDRSAAEFLNGHNASGADIRAFYGSYDYWAEEAALGNPGKVVYYATAVGSTPATNNPNKWLANQWGKFDPGLYDASNGTSDNYQNSCPAYVNAGGGPANYGGAPWEIHFATTAAQNAQGSYVELSVGLAAAEGSLTVALNGHSETWHVANASDPMVRSGEAGFYQWLVYEYPTSDLNAVGSDNVFTFSTSQTDGDMYDALRMEITKNSSNPSVTGWYDYNYVTGSNSQTAPVDSTGSTASNTFSGTSQWTLSTGGSWTTSTHWLNYIIPAAANDVATFANTITAASTVTLDGNRTAGSVIFNSPQSYTIAPGTGGSLTLNQSGGATISDLAGTHFISAAVILASNTQITVANATDSLTFSNTISGTGNLTTSGNGTINLTGTTSYTGSTTVVSGTLNLSSGASVTSGSFNTGTGATLIINGTVPVTAAVTGVGTTTFGPGPATGIFNRTIGSLTLATGSSVTVTAPTLRANRTVLATGALNFGGTTNAWLGKLNLADNDMIVRSGNLSNITNQIKAGYAAGGKYWNGSTGITSTSAASDTTHLTALGSGLSLGSAFDGLPTSTSDVLIKYTYFGDANLDGKVDGSDYSRIDSGYLSHATGWSNGDFNYDGVVNGSDYTLIDNAFNTQSASLTSVISDPQANITAEIATPASALPEPAGIGLIILSGLLGRRRCRLSESL